MVHIPAENDRLKPARETDSINTPPGIVPRGTNEGFTMSKRKKMTTEERAANKAKRAAKMRDRMRGVVHRLFGSLTPDPVPGTVFDPLAYLTCPGRYRDVQSFFRSRAARAGVGAGLPRETRAAVLDDATANGMDFFIHRDYEAAGFDADAAAPALLSAARWLDRARWRSIDTGRFGEYARKGSGDFALYNRATTARAAGDNPATAVAAAEALGMAWGEVFPACHEIPGAAVALPGGPSGRGETDGRMIRDGGRIRWRMKRGRGRAKKYAPGIVRDSIPTTAPRHVRGPMATGNGGPIEWRKTPGGPVSYAANPEAYRAAIAAYREPGEPNYGQEARAARGEFESWRAALAERYGD